jgi:hypothetical protein
MSDLLEEMKRNPKGDWTVNDIAAVCRAHNISFEAPKRGSHYKVSHPKMAPKVTIPFKRPIKPVYIRRLTTFISSVRKIDGTS